MSTKCQSLSECHIGNAPIAIMTGEYLKIPHTFIHREVAAIRASGQEIVVISVRQPREQEALSAESRQEFDRVFFLLRHAQNPLRLIWAHTVSFALRPLGYFRTILLAFRTTPPGFLASIYQIFYFLEAGVLAEYLRQKKVVHLHNHFGDSSCTVAMLAAKLRGVSFSYTEHGPDTFFAPNRWRLDAKVSCASFVVAISHFCRSQLMLFADPADWHKIKIVHCGVIPARYDNGPRSEPGKRILFVGRLAAVKGVPLLLEALFHLKGRHPQARLTLVGDGPERPSLEALTRRLDLSDLVEFAGYSDEAGVASHLAQADLLVLPSFAEGLPVVLMEAMAARLPVIASRVAGVPELVDDGLSGFLFPPSDLETMIMRMDTLLSDPQIGLKMGEAGREKVMAEHDATREASKLLKLFLQASLTTPFA